MYKVVVADDEVWIREGLKQTIDWDLLGVGTVDCAENGLEVLEIIKNSDPDIVITDIRMPNISGIEILQYIRDNGKKARTIIISGYRDFTYAQQAVKFGAYDYILKPIDEKILEEIVKKCILEIEEERSKKLEKERLLHDIKLKNIELKEVFFEEVFQKNSFIPDMVFEKFEAYGIKLKKEMFLVSTIILPGYRSANISLEKIVDRVNTVLTDFRDIAFPMKKNEIVMLLSTDNRELNVLKSAAIEQGRIILDALEELYNLHAVLGIGEEVHSIENVRLSYVKARAAGSYGIVNEIAVVDLDIINCGVDNHMEVSFKECFKNGDKKLVIQLLKNKFRILLTKQVLFSIDEFKLVFIRYIDSLLVEIENLIPYQTRLSCKDKAVKALNEKNSLESIFFWSEEFLSELLERSLNEKGSSKRRVVEDVIRYINNNYYKDITLQDAANEVYLNPTYLSKVFSEETGENFSRYIIKIRIERAKELLKDQSLKLYTISDMVGYRDVSHFTKTFKEVVGITPAHFRERAN